MSLSICEASQVLESPEQWLAGRIAGPMPAGAVLFHAPNTAWQAPGGGEVQLVQTGQAIERLGYRIRPFVCWSDRLEDARLLHLFGMSREGLALARLARRMGVPMVLSPIAWHEPSSFRALEGSSAASTRAWVSWVSRRMFARFPHWRRELLLLADVVLPNSTSEARQQATLFGIAPQKFRVIPNGVEERFRHAQPGLARERIGLDDFVLYAGRIEPRKNVLGLVRALKSSGLPLVILGDAVPGHEGYKAQCQSVGAGFTHWLPRVEHDDPLLESAYAAARVFALPSWFETPGLAALEAALAGSALVITCLGSTYEYFGGFADYVHPAKERQIREAVERAWHTGSQPALARRVGSRYLWDRVGRMTAEVYDDLIG